MKIQEIEEAVITKSLKHNESSSVPQTRKEWADTLKPAVQRATYAVVKAGGIIADAGVHGKSVELHISIKLKFTANIFCLKNVKERLTTRGSRRNVPCFLFTFTKINQTFD